MSDLSNSFSDKRSEKTPILVNSVSAEGNVEVKIEEVLSEKDKRFSFRKLTRKKKLTFMTLGFVNFCACTCFSLLAPFFPNEAEKKGASQTVIGLIFSCFEFWIFASSPVFGNFLTRIGAKFMFISGICVCGVCAILFGLLDKCPNGDIFIVMCFVCRTVEALGCSAFITSSFAIVAHTFPDNVATVFGTLETFSGMGLMVGPPIGGALYELGGYGLPFWTLGGTLLLCASISCVIMPLQEDAVRAYKGSILTLLKSCLIWLTGFCIFCGSFSLGFLDPTLADHLKPFNLSTLIVGIVFLCAPGMYGFTAPLWGWFIDNKSQVKSLMILGNSFAAVAFLLMGPCPLLPFLPSTLWLNVVSLLMVGVFVGCALLPSLKVLLLGAKKLGFDDSLDTFGLVSGFFNSAFSLGTFIGPTIGGIMNQHLGFDWAATLASGLFITAGLLISLQSMASRKCSSCCHDNVETDNRTGYTTLKGRDDPCPAVETQSCNYTEDSRT